MPATTTSGRHLDPVLQDQALDLLIAGWRQADVAAHMGFTGSGNSPHSAHHATNYAVNASAARRGLTVPRTRRQAVRIPVTQAPAAPVDVELLARRFGVELEFAATVGRSTAARFLRDAGLDAMESGYTHAVTRGWKVLQDGSCGNEAVSPILTGEGGWESLRSATRALTAAGCQVTSACGTHVHHDVSDLTAIQLRQVLSNVRACQHALASYMADGRMRRNWCQPISRHEWDAMFRNFDNGTFRTVVHGSARGCPFNARFCGGSRCEHRYRDINLTPLLSYGTIEFRQHSGTLNAGKLKPWIAVGQAIVEAGRRGVLFAGTQSVRTMLDTLVGEGILHARMARKFAEQVEARHGAARLDRVTEGN